MCTHLSGKKLQLDRAIAEVMEKVNSLEWKQGDGIPLLAELQAAIDDITSRKDLDVASVVVPSKLLASTGPNQETTDLFTQQKRLIGKCNII